MTKIAKVPVVLQMEALECGAASLCMVLAHFGKWLPLEQVRADCGVSRDGSSARNVVRAARSYGLKADGYRMEVDDLRKINGPVIIHWNFRAPGLTDIEKSLISGSASLLYPNLMLRTSRAPDNLPAVDLVTYSELFALNGTYHEADFYGELRV